MACACNKSKDVFQYRVTLSSGGTVTRDTEVEANMYARTHGGGAVKRIKIG